MVSPIVKAFLFLPALSAVNAYWLMAINNFITTERLDPIISPGGVSAHVHSVMGGSNFASPNLTTAKLRESECTSIPIAEDNSAYWFPHLYFQWANGSFTSLTGGAVIYYLFDDKPGTVTAFPDDFRMITGDPTLRTYDPNNFGQTAVTFLCLHFNGVTTRHHGLPNEPCPSGVRAQINFQSCWDGKNVDSPDHKSHVAYRSEGADQGSCKDPKFPVTLPRIFIEMYWDTHTFDQFRSQAMNKTQPFVYAYGDRTGYGYHADYINGWDKGVLQKAIDGCNCNPFGDTKCCVDKGLYNLDTKKKCYISKSVDEVVTGTLPKLPGNNPVQEEGHTATMFKDPETPGIIRPVYAYSDKPTATGRVVVPPTIDSGSPASLVTPTSAVKSPSTASHIDSSTEMKATGTTENAPIGAVKNSHTVDSIPVAIATGANLKNTVQSSSGAVGLKNTIQTTPTLDSPICNHVKAHRRRRNLRSY